MQRSTFETILGASILAIAISVGIILYKGQLTKSKDTYALFGNFDHIDGIRKESEIKISGITISNVVESDLDPKTHLARVKI
ncbi:MAG: hypothetical protein Q8S31_03425 [Alphaproteobacteria bacterium]|nr:hypothetical protein [Alphaproteobacteria bacterium]